MYDKISGGVLALADILDRDAPVMPEVVEDRQKAGGITLWSGDYGIRDVALGVCVCGGLPCVSVCATVGSTDFAAMCASGPFDDETTRSFYEDYPLLRETMPAKLFESDRGAKSSAASAAATPTPASAPAPAPAAAATASAGAASGEGGMCFYECRHSRVACHVVYVMSCLLGVRVQKPRPTAMLATMRWRKARRMTLWSRRRAWMLR
jgi:hypothetical protein